MYPANAGWHISFKEGGNNFPPFFILNITLKYPLHYKYTLSLNCNIKISGREIV